MNPLRTHVRENRAIDSVASDRLAYGQDGVAE
jgi:hypothetical protein